jgi:hypothetical protein
MPNLVIAALIVAWLLPAPKWLLVSFGIPLLIVLGEYMALLPPVFSVGTVDIQIYDAVSLLVAGKLALSILWFRRSLHVQPIHRHIIWFLFVLMATTLLAFFRFGAGVFLSQSASFLRFVSQVGIFYLCFYSLRNPMSIVNSNRMLLLLGYLIGASVYISALLIQFGIPFGEVQETEFSVRYFGPLGDQVGFFIVFFCLREFIAGNLLRGLFFSGAIIATGTRGAILSLACGMAVCLFAKRRAVFSRKGWVLLAGLAGITTLLLASSIGQMTLGRFTDIDVWEAGFTQRRITMSLAMKVISENLMTGVGFSGFRHAVLAYNPEGQFGQFAENFIVNTSNQYLQVLTDAGIIGLIVFLFLMIQCFHVFKVAGKCAKGGLEVSFVAGQAWLISLLIGNQSAVWIAHGSLISCLLWILLGMGAAAIHMAIWENDTTDAGIPR